ncbi:LuxR family transcriptional regulator [Paroceanicella profunda]|uniref:LuxR family transcriptional regulator n=1 Tax=Paroceanicella profunda TaxID=2579971 RepID=A0A5B8FV40_9RHOB|nr:LuxR family transcriptional regulator [Paroceanicella profunda]QDL90940.1 LuxR family transcriptional regulator [Paroceanicella profunda]
MTRKLETVLETLKAIHCPEGLQAFVEDLRGVYDVEHVVYHALNIAGSPYAALTYRNDWVDRYVEEDLARVDPVIQTATRRFHPLDWKRLDWSAPGARAMLADGIANGLGNQGYTLPVRGPRGQFALFTVNAAAGDRTWDQFTADFGQDLLLISHFIHQKVLEIEAVDDKAPGRDLSPRERDTLHFLALGYARAQIAERLGISEHTLRVYVDSARVKLGALNATQAVAVAVSAGIIFP